MLCISKISGGENLQELTEELDGSLVLWTGEFAMESTSGPNLRRETNLQSMVGWLVENSVGGRDISAQEFVEIVKVLQVQQKKCNSLTQKRLNDLVYVKYNLRLHEKVEGEASYEALDLDDIDPYSVDWIAPPDGEDADADVGDPLLTDEQLAEFDMEADDWDADVAIREEEHELGHPSEGSVKPEAPIQDVATATTSTPPSRSFIKFVFYMYWTYLYSDVVLVFLVYDSITMLIY